MAMDFWRLWDTSGFPARWYCGTAWQEEPFWGWLTLLSDIAVWGAYCAIPLLLAFYIRERPSLKWRKLIWLFVAFIFFCGTTHLIDACIFWWPVYRLQAVMKFGTAVVSWMTVIAMIPAIPYLLRARLPEDLELLVQQRTNDLNHLAVKLAAVFETANDAIVTLDSQGVITSANPAFETIFGVPRQEALYRPLDDFLPTQQFGSDGLVSEVRNHELEGRYVDGGTVDLEVSINAMKGTGEAGYVAVLRDTSARKRNETELRILNRAIECVPHGILITDAQLPDHPIVYSNAAFESITGYTREEVEGTNCRFLQGPETEPEKIALLRKAIESQDECETTLLNYRKDGTPFWNSLHLSPVEDDAGTVTHFVGLQSDVTNRIEYEQQLKEARASAESANRAKSDFLANMSHEIRTPLTAILGCADVLARNVEQPDSLAIVRTVRNQGQLLLGVLNDILDLSRIEAGKMEIHEEDCNLVQILGDVLSLMAPGATEKGIPLELKITSQLPRVLKSDPLRLRQILLNLVGNAVKFTSSGTVKLLVDCTPQETNHILTMRVRDTGHGISPEKLEHIFEPFIQDRSTSESHIGGTGLGLNICQQLTEILGGTISVKSKVDHGTEFTVQFPLGPLPPEDLCDADILEQETEAQTSSLDLSYSLPTRVLVAEDNRGIQFMISRMLEPVVDDLEIVANGDMAVLRVMQAEKEGHPFGLILMDMQMPVMNGFEATRKLRGIGCRIPIIALTAGAMSGDREECFNAGCTDYLSKPIDRHQLLAKLHQHGGHSSADDTESSGR